MGAQEIPPHGSSWALSNTNPYTALPTLSAVPVENSSAGAGTRPGRRSILALAADIATAVDTSWRRRDLAWCAIPITLAVLLGPH